jgi:branched-chain amino acid transport system substrate-binding protein
MRFALRVKNLRQPRGRSWLLLVALCGAALTSLVLSTGGGARTVAKCGYPPGWPEPQIGDLVRYICGKPGKANPKLSPIRIGWVNNQGGSVVPVGPTATEAADFAVSWINRYGGGIGGHPLKLDKCFVKNAEEEGLKCGQKFLNDPGISAIAYGGVATGANTIGSTVAGKKPIVAGFSLSASDVTQPNTYIFFAAANFGLYGWGTFGHDVLKAKTNAVIYPQGTGFTQIAAAVKEASESVGIKTTLVGFNPNATDLLGALTAAGAGSADMVSPILVSQGNCVAAQRGLDQLHVDPGKVVGFFPCIETQLKDAYGGDFPKWWYGQAQSGDVLLDNPTGRAYRKALAAIGRLSKFRDVWYSGMFGEIMTVALFLNKLGPDKITPAGIAKLAKAFQGPLLLGGPVVFCGKYPDYPANCGDGDRFFRYLGDGKFKVYPKWIETPLPLQKKLHAKTR